MKSNSNELVAIGSGMEPPKERLISLTPVPLVAHQKPTSEALKKAVTDEGFDVNVMVCIFNLQGFAAKRLFLVYFSC